MFQPRHTVESVTNRIMEGLHDGTVVVPAEEEPISVDAAQLQLTRALAVFRKRAWRFLTLTLILAISSAALAVSLVLSGQGEGSSRLIAQLMILLFCCSGGFMAGCLFVFLKAREKATEIKTYVSVLKFADDKTAQRLASRVSKKFKAVGS